MQRFTAALAAGALLAASAWVHAAAPDTAAVEFYNTSTGHYFVTASAAEALGIDAGAAGPGWVRTGRSFQAWLSKAAAPADAQPVCRFYSTGANSHFYTASASECAGLKAMAASELASTGTVRGWQYEGTAFYIQAPNTSGQCPAGTTTIQRVYNDGFRTGAGSNHRFLDDPQVVQLMADRHWHPEGAVFCAVDNPATGTEANLAPTVVSFDAVAGTWTGSGEWNTETPSGETHATQSLTLTIASDGSITGNGDGCTFAGQLAVGDGFRAFFLGTATATGCSDPAFAGDFPKVRLELLGNGTLMARLQRGDDASGEVSIEARLQNGDAGTPPTTPATPSFASVAGDWTGTVAWVAEQHLAAGNMLEPVASNKPLSLTISDTGDVTGDGFGCTVTGTLQPQPANGMGEQGGFTGDITLAGCDQAFFDGTFTNVHFERDGPSRLVVNLHRETQDAQGGTTVEIEGVLLAPGTSAPPPSQPEAPVALTGSWQGSAGFLAVQRQSGTPDVVVSQMQDLSLTIGTDGSVSGSGFGCTFSGTLTLSSDATQVTGGTVSASGCTEDVFNGDYSNPKLVAEDGRLEVELERESSSSGTETQVRIVGKLSPAAP